MKNERLIDCAVIFGIGAFLIIAEWLNWFEAYKGFALIPFILVYSLGKYVGAKQAKHQEKP